MKQKLNKLTQFGILALGIAMLLTNCQKDDDFKIECQQDTYYDIAEATWQNMQQEIVNWINDDTITQGGQAVVNAPKAVRVSKERIVELLTTNESIDQILSNCN